MHDDDLSIINRIRNGDTDSFRILVDRHKSKLFGTLIRLVGDRDLASELAQDAFVKAFTSLQGFRGDASFSTWLIQIGLHGARDHVRRLQRQRSRGVVSLEAYLEHRSAGDFELQAVTPSPDDDLDRREVAAGLAAALDDLPPNYREVFVLKHVEGWSYEDIAKSVGDSVGSLKVRAHRARRMLRESLSRQAAETDVIDITQRREERRGRTDRTVS